jgi:hypothetical protein
MADDLIAAELSGVPNEATGIGHPPRLEAGWLALLEGIKVIGFYPID